jgi:hypothetical protein
MPPGSYSPSPQSDLKLRALDLNCHVGEVRKDLGFRKVNIYYILSRVFRFVMGEYFRILNPRH